MEFLNSNKTRILAQQVVSKLFVVPTNGFASEISLLAYSEHLITRTQKQFELCGYKNKQNFAWLCEIWD